MPGDYYTLPQERAGRALVRTGKGIELISNVCRHRQAVMLKGRGSLLAAKGRRPATSCARCTAGPTARRGDLIGAPHFAHDPCLNLNNYQGLREWNGLLFEDNGRRHRCRPGRHGPVWPGGDLDFSGFVLDRVELHECNYNWKTFIEVYLEDYHVGPFHPGLGSFVTCDDLRWEFMANHYSVQTVGVANRLGKPGSPVYERWHDVLLKYRNGGKPRTAPSG
jgi:choline monooxygenase